MGHSESPDFADAGLFQDDFTGWGSNSTPFLHLCDLLVEGQLAKIPEEALKVLEVVQAYRLSAEAQKNLEVIASKQRWEFPR